MDPDTNRDDIEWLRSVGRSWWWVLIFGIVTLIVGVVLTFKPGASVQALAIIFAIWLLLLGVFWIVAALTHHGEAGGSRTGMILLGLLAVLVALLVMHHSFETVAILGFIVGVFWVIGGVALLVSGLSHDATGRRTGPIVVGLIFAVTGVICLVYPGLSLSILAVILGIGLIITGFVEIMLAFQVKKLEHIEPGGAR
jgi:hypothetical protein